MKKILLIVLLSLAGQVVAGVVKGKVDWIRIRASDGLIYFRIDGTSVDKPACSTSTNWSIKDENSNAGKAQLSALLAAQASGKMITVNGSNQCTRWADMEDANIILIE
ncbi:hypothetical protein [Pleionea litopenaei]|uniref:Uncharacterized protein n=1 Tax=Pleionea litopenaei TaxID=3070815 RepID=A0AA51RU10_9GAMM|nr:hypothetical protein [Pleionea sp. HL-JVS1]WMS87500.1 hypothetical protein Q9312_00885 [Pleionea sp. HL-JVS1]